MQMSFRNFSGNNEFSEIRCSSISTLRRALYEFMFVIWVFIKRCELKSLWKVTIRCRSVVNKYPEIDTIKATIYSELKKRTFLYLQQFWSDYNKIRYLRSQCNAVE